MQRTPRSFIKNAKERKNVAFFWKEHLPNPAVYFPIFLSSLLLDNSLLSFLFISLHSCLLSYLTTVLSAHLSFLNILVFSLTSRESSQLPYHFPTFLSSFLLLNSHLSFLFTFLLSCLLSYSISKQASLLPVQFPPRLSSLLYFTILVSAAHFHCACSYCFTHFITTSCPFPSWMSFFTFLLSSQLIFHFLPILF